MYSFTVFFFTCFLLGLESVKSMKSKYFFTFSFVCFMLFVCLLAIVNWFVSLISFSVFSCLDMRIGNVNFVMYHFPKSVDPKALFCRGRWIRQKLTPGQSDEEKKLCVVGPTKDLCMAYGTSRKKRQN